MIYTNKNTAPKATVYNADAKCDIEHVMSVDTKNAVLEVAEYPFRVVGDVLATVRYQFRSIYPIHGGTSLPELFICFGEGQKPWA